MNALRWDLPLETDTPDPVRVFVMDPPYSMGPLDTHGVIWWDSTWGETATYELDGSPCPGDPTLPNLRNCGGFWPRDITVPPPQQRGRITAYPPTPRELAEGLFVDRDGRLRFECIGCGQNKVLLCDPQDFDPDMALCGGSPRCCP